MSIIEIGMWTIIGFIFVVSSFALWFEVNNPDPSFSDITTSFAMLFVSIVLAGLMTVL